MVDDNVKQLWYVFRSIDGIVLLFFLWVVTLACKWVMRRILQNRGKRRPLRPSMVHSLGILRPSRKSDPSESKTVDLDPSDIESIG